MKKSSIALIAIFLLFAFLGMTRILRAGAKVDAWLDRTQISLGETVQLSIKAEGRQSGEIDTSPLEKDFQVLDTSTGSSMNIINGSISSSTTWQISLQPKKEGHLTVPALKVAGQYTEPLSLTVSASPAPQADSGADIFVESEVSANNPYERQQVVYTVRLFSAVKLADGSLSAPQPQHTIVQQLGDDRDYETTRNSRRYRVIERRYALFPQQAGTLTLPAPVFEGKVYRRSRNPHTMHSFFGNDPFFDHDAFGMFSSTTVEPVRITGKGVSLQVRPHPQNVSGADWLPAQSVAMREAWQPEAKTLKVGEAVTRTITVTAAGQEGAMLPDLTPAGLAGFKVYPDKAEVKDDPQPDGISGTRQQKIAFIPVRPGTFSLPEVTLQWWDSRENRMQTASLPAHTITVLPGDNQFAAPAPPPQTPQGTGESPPPASGKGQGRFLAGRPFAAAGQFPWRIAALTLAAGWAGTLLLWRRDRRRTTGAIVPPSAPQKPPALKGPELRKAFLAACQRGDAWRARSALLRWGAARWPEDPPKGLAELARRLDDTETVTAIHELDHCLYGADPTQWDGGKLASLLRRFPERKKEHASKQEPLPPLYP